MTKPDNITTFNMRFPKVLFLELKRHQLQEIIKRIKTVSLHELILGAIITMLAGE
jgi:hypothetical protein